MPSEHWRARLSKKTLIGVQRSCHLIIHKTKELWNISRATKNMWLARLAYTLSCEFASPWNVSGKHPTLGRGWGDEIHNYLQYSVEKPLWRLLWKTKKGPIYWKIHCFKHKPHWLSFSFYSFIWLQKKDSYLEPVHMLSTIQDSNVKFSNKKSGLLNRINNIQYQVIFKESTDKATASRISWKLQIRVA